MGFLELFSALAVVASVFGGPELLVEPTSNTETSQAGCYYQLGGGRKQDQIILVIWNSVHLSLLVICLVQSVILLAKSASRSSASKPSSGGPLPRPFSAAERVPASISHREGALNGVDRRNLQACGPTIKLHTFGSSTDTYGPDIRSYASELDAVAHTGATLISPLIDTFRCMNDGHYN
ncbi:hypothetical protein CPB86DRAFT_821917 [Serendipita vermifera]|nr:hypothetical protein CPB86DRAFT_821917 [Serendipita vermifera]